MCGLINLRKHQRALCSSFRCTVGVQLTLTILPASVKRKGHCVGTPSCCSYTVNLAALAHTLTEISLI